MREDNRTHSKEIRRYQHLMRVYKDPDFTREVEALRKALESKYGAGVSFQVADTGIDFYAKLGVPFVKDTEDRKRVERLAADWTMSLEDLAYFADGYSGKNSGSAETTEGAERVVIVDGKRRIKTLPVPKPTVMRNKNIKIGTQENEVVIKIGPMATQEDVLDNWQNVEYAKRLVFGPKRRQREAVNYDLVYVYFKALKSGKTDSEIYNLYLTEKLPGYTKEHGRNKLYGDHHSLKKYYNRHKPTTDT